MILVSVVVIVHLTPWNHPILHTGTISPVIGNVSELTPSCPTIMAQYTYMICLNI